MIETKQQELWHGDFGDAYHGRNESVDRSEFWKKVIGARLMGIRSIIEPGAGKGDNLVAIRKLAFQEGLFPRVTGIDVNEGACRTMEQRGVVAVHGAFPNINMANEYDLVLTRGFLIHLPKAELEKALDRIFEMSRRYICFAEYYSSSRRMVSYRGNRNAMWTGDYAGMLMKRYPHITLLKYGFDYWQEGGYDITWFLMEKV